MTTKKQQGNKLYQSSKFEQAIAKYEQYLEEEHDDHKAVYYNMSLCYFKLKQYERSMEACGEAITLDHAYAKAYYRRVICGRELLKSQNAQQQSLRYGIYYDALMFCQYCNKDNISQMQEMKKEMKENYKIFNSTKPQHQNNTLDNMIAIERENIQVLAKSKIMQFQNVKNKNSNNDRLRNQINELYKKLKGTKDSIQQQSISNQINKLKSLKMDKKVKEYGTQQQINHDKEQEHNQQQPKKEEVKEQVKEQDTKQQCPQQKKQSIEQQVKQEVKEQQRKQEHKQQQQQEQVVNEQNMITEMEDTQLYHHYFFKHIQKSQDMFTDFIIIIRQVLANKEITHNLKNTLLKLITQRYTKFKLVKKSLSEVQREELKNKMKKIGVKENIAQMYILK